ncbi:MAG TPA: RNA pseudouridine synthase [Phycisphaerales bacterium]|jgi:23S rRNA-/tRNA-specific pseudouridylate synthase|nr:RNA pseudouridine synthase [Phycisphaerales bacterium]
MHTEPTILHRTEHWMVVDKPAQWHSVAGPGDQSDVETWLRATEPACRDQDDGGLVHRLDLPTSGCLLVALNDSTHDFLRSTMSGRTDQDIGKQYLARCDVGLADAGQFELYFSKRHRGSRKMTVRTFGTDAELGRCVWRSYGQTPDGELLAIDLLGPGRRHQIRAGLADLHHPIHGDTVYGQADDHRPLCLHAWAIHLDGHRIESPPPDWAR